MKFEKANYLIDGRIWHRGIIGDYKFNDSGFNLSFKLGSTPSGCGSLLLFGYSSFGTPTSAILEELDIFFNNLKKDGVGSIITTQGQGCREFDDNLQVKILKDVLGMVDVSEYSNYRHEKDGSYKQRLYIKTL